MEQTWLYQIHSQVFTAQLTDNDHMLLNKILCWSMNVQVILYINYINAPQDFTSCFCLVVGYVTTNILKLSMTDLELYQQN